MKTRNEASPGPAPAAKLEKLPVAASRMGISLGGVYHELKVGRLAGPLVKVGIRASAVPSESVDAWIADRISDAMSGGRQSAQGGCHG